MKIETLSIHVGREVSSETGAVAPAIQLSSTYERDTDGSFSRGYVYTRLGNPGRSALEQCLAALEGGAEAFAFASGSAASLAAFSVLRPGDHVVAPIESYHGTAKQLRELISPYGVSCSFVDLTRVEALQAALTERTRMVWIETPSNPLLNLSDIERLAELAHARGALVCVDNTFATPLWQRPFELGADLVMHSTTKYFGGHSDVLGGALIVKEGGALATQLRDYQGTSGAVPSAFDCWLIRRSLTTFPWRVRGQSANAQRVASFLSQHPLVSRVFYPGLPDHPGHELACRQMRGGFGAVVSMCVRGGRAEAFSCAARLQLFTRATSLGGVESLVEHRASVEGPHSVTPDNLLRLSIGLEHADDLIEDLDRSLQP
ncbi:MAG TPA: aminotransferase class I/II-fold pyridoxal phosphate-dependent enzyme [Polyangiales bacterium]|nr:aminotransferase class I/II-fold pyridoxal phosphate-dependent enzyme [Polyangiales bacterium]